MRGHGYIPGKVSVVIVCWNQWDLTERCVQSIIKSGDLPHEFVFVDNASTDATAEKLPLLADGQADVQRVTLTQNVGWGRGANIGSQLAEGEYLLHLNNDTEVHDGWLSPLLAEMEDPEVIAVAGTLLNSDGSIQHAGTGLYFDDGGVLTAANLTDASDARDVDALSLAAALVRADAWNHLGGIDPIFWCGYEDVDFCLRARSEHLRLRYTPESVVTHIAHGSGEARWSHTGDNIRALHNRWGRLLSANPDLPLLD